MHGDAEKGLYKFKYANCSSFTKVKNLCEKRNNSSMFDLWLYKLGHPCVKVVRQILTENKITFDDISLTYICTYCQMGKSHNLASNDSLT